MSRIHEALKRAEQERAAQGAGGSESSIFAPIRDSMPPRPATVPGMAALSEAANLDTLLARCHQAKWTPDAKTMLFFSQKEEHGAEEFRTLRSRLYQMREKRPLKKILVTSSLPKEGKSFVAANLAQALVRQQGRRALLIDADLRAPRLHLALGAPSIPGVSEYLLGENDEFSVIQCGAMEHLFFIPSGRVVPNAAELVSNGRLKYLLEKVEPWFDWIVVDSPPSVPVSDASLLASACDGVLLVVRSSKTPFDAAIKMREQFNQDQLLGVVLNGIGAENGGYPRYYGSYSNYGRKNGRLAEQR